MADRSFEVEIDDRAVTVRLIGSECSPHGRLHALIWFVAMVLVVDCAVLFLPGKRGAPSMWQEISSHPIASVGFVFPLVFLLSFSAILFLILRRYVMAV